MRWEALYVLEDSRAGPHFSHFLAQNLFCKVLGVSSLNGSVCLQKGRPKVSSRPATKSACVQKRVSDPFVSGPPRGSRMYQEAMTQGSAAQRGLQICIPLTWLWHPPMLILT